MPDTQKMETPAPVLLKVTNTTFVEFSHHHHYPILFSTTVFAIIAVSHNNQFIF
jgi:hypothetical protein